METTSFVLGMLTVIGAAVTVLVVLGMVRIHKLTKEVKVLREEANQDRSHIYERIDQNADDFFSQVDRVLRQSEETTNELYNRIDETRREILSYTDSRFDKLTSRREPTS
jgi:predicted Holliday junction resolvase-like endonuclease